MAVYKKGPEIWKPFEGYAQAGKSGDIIIEDNLDYEAPVFLIDWSTEKFRNTSGSFDISGTWTKIINESSYLLTPSASINGIDVVVTTPFPAGSPLSTVWLPSVGEYQYVSFWVNTSEEYYNNNNEGHSIIVFDSNNGDSVTFYLDGDAAGNGLYQVGVNFRDSSGDVILQSNLSSGLTVNAWHHVVFKWKTVQSKLDDQILNSYGEIYINGDKAPSFVSTTASGSITHQALDPNLLVGGTGGVGLGVTSTGFQGLLGNFNIFSSNRDDLENVIYRLEKWGASKLHSGIHSFGERVERDIISRQEKYPPSFGGLTATNSSLGSDPFHDPIDISWNPQRPIGSYIYSSSSVPFTGLSASDPLTDGYYRSETKSLFFSDDMTNWEVQSETRTDLYKTIEPEDGENQLVFDDTLRVGEDDDPQYRDRIVIDIPIEITTDTVLGGLRRVQTQIPNTTVYIENIESDHVAYYNFDSKEFDIVQTNDFFQPFSPAQGVTVEPGRGWKWTFKNLARPIHGGGFPQLSVYEQDHEATLDLSEYLKDDFILEGYEVILEVDHTDGGAIAHKSSGFGLSHRIGGTKRSNDFGAPLDKDGADISNAKNSLSTKVFTTFLMRQKGYTSDPSVRDTSGTKVRISSLGAISTPKYGTELEFTEALNEDNPYRPNPDETNVKLNYLGGFIGNGSEDSVVSDFAVSVDTERDLISYGQTVLTTADGQKESITQEMPMFTGQANSVNHPDWWFSGDGTGLGTINREIQNSTEPTGIDHLFSDRSQVIYTDFDGITAGTTVLEQIVSLQTNEKTERTIPYKNYKMTNPSDFTDVFDTGVEPLFYPSNYEFHYSSSEQSWEGGGNQWSLIEPRMIPTVIGNSSSKECADTKLVNIDPYTWDPNLQTEWERFTVDNTSHQNTKIGNESPEENLDGFILRPNDRLIFGVCNSISQMQGSYVQSVDGNGVYQGNPIFLHENSLTIKSSVNAGTKPKLRLFGRYKRKDEFINPTPNLSLFHNSDVNEPLFNEDVKDQFDVEELSSYKGGLADDIIGDDFQSVSEISLVLGFPNFNDSQNYPYINTPIVGNISGSIALVKEAAFDPNNYVFNGQQIEWTTFNDKVFPGIPVEPGQVDPYEFSETGDEVVANAGVLALNDSILTQPNEQATYRSFVQFLTDKTQYVWNTIDENGQGLYRHLRKGGYVLEELSTSGYDTVVNANAIDSTIQLTVWNNGNPQSVQYPRNISDFPGLTFDTNMGKHAWQFKQTFSLVNSEYVGNEVNGWQLKNVTFIPIILDRQSNILVRDHTGNTTALDVGDSFYFPKDTNGTLNNGVATKINLAALGSVSPSWSLELDEGISPLNIFIIVAKGTPILVTDNNGYDALHTNKGGGSYYDGLGQYAMKNFTSVMTFQEVYEAIVDIIDFECENNSSLLLRKDETSLPSETFKFPVTDSSLEFYDALGEIIEQFVDVQNNSYTAVTNSTGTSNGKNYSPAEFANEFWGFVFQWVPSQSLVKYLPFKFADVDLSNWPVITWDTTKTSTSIFDNYSAPVPTEPQDLAFYEKSILTVNRKIIARTTEPVPKLNIWGEDDGESRNAGLLGGLKKFMKVEDPLFVYGDTVSKVSNGTPRSSILDVSGWVGVDEPVSPDIDNDLVKLESVPEEYDLKVTSEVVDGVRVFNQDGLYQRLDIQSTSLDGSFSWPVTDQNNLTSMTLPIESWISKEFPNEYPKNTNVMYLYRGLGSNKDGTIKIYPTESLLSGWSSDGPTPIPDAMVMEPLRGARWGTMNPTKQRRAYWFSRTRYGQPVDFIEFGVDGAMSPTLSRHASYPFNGPAVLIKLFSRQDPDIEVPLVDYENIALETTPFQEINETVESNDTALATTVFGQSVTASLAAGTVDGDNLKVNLVGQIGKQAAFQPGNIISRIKRT